MSHKDRMKAPCVANECMLSVLVVRGVVEVTEQSGVTRDRLLRAAGLDNRLLDSDTACVPRQQVSRLCELAVELTEDPALGLHWSERLSPNTFNPISHLIDHSVTLRQGFESLFKFHRLVSDQPSFDLSEAGDSVTLRYFGLPSESLRMQRFASEMLVSGIHRIIRSFAPQARAERVCFEHAAPEYRAEYTRIFDGTERFDQAFTGIVFDRALMDAVSRHKDSEVHDALRAIAERRILRLTERAPFALRVRERLVQLGPARADMNAVARALGLCARSLRRRLQAEGKSYNELVNEALAIVAKRLLRDDRMTIQETAYEMGFADSSTFHRAFKRWTGMTPNSFREQGMGL